MSNEGNNSFHLFIYIAHLMQQLFAQCFSGARMVVVVGKKSGWEN